MTPGDVTPSVDELLDRAIAALNRGDVAGAHALADEVLATDAGNPDAEQLRATAAPPGGELRRLTLVFCDLVGSTELSAVLEPEAYHDVLQHYQALCRTVVEQQGRGSIISFRGDGILAAFGYPEAHEDDVDRAVLAGLDLVRGVGDLTGASTTSTGVAVRVAVHRGLVFVDRDRGDLYGLAANVAARIESLAAPGTVVVSDEVRALLGDRYDIESNPSRPVKGLAQPLATHTVLGERLDGHRHLGSSPLVGRGAELELLRAGWDQAVRGERPPGACVAVTGDAGIGKSRLVAALRQEVLADGGAVVELAGSPRHESSGLFPFRRALELLAGIERTDDGAERLRKLGGLLPTAPTGDPHPLRLLATLLGIDPSAGYEPVAMDARQLREEIEAAVIGYLRSWCAPSGSLLLVEDLHWFDPGSRDLVNTILRADQPDRLIVVTSRNPADAPRGSGTVHVELGALEERDRMALVHAVAGDVLDELALRDVADQSDGIPLFAEELARAAASGTGAAAGASVDASVPDPLYGALVARLNVSPPVMEVATTAALIGRDVDPDLLVRVSATTDADRAEALGVLLAERLLVPSPEEPGRVRFRHELLRSVVADLVPPTRQRALRRAIAQAMAPPDSEPDAVDWLIVATHYEAAGDTGPSASAFGKAAAVASQRGDLLEARILLTRAIGLIEASEGGAAPELEVDLRLRRGFLAVSLEGNSSPSTAADYERSLELALASNHAGAVLSALGCIGSYHAARAEFDRSREILGGLVQVEGPLHDFASFFAITGHALCDIYCGNMRRGLASGREGLALRDRFESATAYLPWWYTPLDPGVLTHTLVAVGEFSTGNVHEAKELFRAARRAAAELPFPNGAFSLAGHLSLEVWLAFELGDDALVEQANQEMTELSARHGFDQWTLVGATAAGVRQGIAAVQAGDRATASACAQTLAGNLMMWKLVDQWVFVTYYLTMLGVLHAGAGELEQARAAYDEAMALTERTGMAFYEVETRRHRAAIEDDPTRREQALREALALARHQGVALYELRTALDLERLTGDLEPTRVALTNFADDAGVQLVDEARARVGGRA